MSFFGEAPSYEAEKRLTAYFLVSFMPPEALDETVRNLYDTWEFYVSADTAAIPQAATRMSSGAIVGKEDRPSLTLAD